MTEDRSAADAGGGHAHHLVSCDYSAMELTGEHEGALADLQRLQERCRGGLEAGLAVIAPDLRHGACRHLAAGLDGSCIFELRGRQLITHGLLGFIASGETCLEIRSQFGGGRSGGDYLLCYMLERTGGLSLPDDPVPGVDFTPSERPAALMALSFAHQLRAAMRRGLPRRYRLRRCNDLRLRGRLDVSRQLQLNLPFTGRCACTAWEYDADHEGTQLVAQALERLWRQRAAAGLLEQLCADPELRSAVCRLRRAAPSAPRRRPAEPWRCALRGVSGALYHPWHALQVMAAMILRGRSADFTAPGRHESCGLLLPGSWMWEAYLEQVLAGLGFTHGRPQCRESGLEVYAAAAGTDGPAGTMVFPDFYISDRVVVDAKYKRRGPRSMLPGAAQAAGSSHGCLTGDDRSQIVAYMHLMGLGRGGHGALIYPRAVPAAAGSGHRGGAGRLRHEYGELSGWGGTLHYVGVPIPRADSYAAFRQAMAQAEAELRALIAGWLA